jgi:hypothetical protein
MPKELFARQQMLKHHMRPRTDTYVQLYNDETKKKQRKIICPALEYDTTGTNVLRRKNYLPGDKC